MAKSAAFCALFSIVLFLFATDSFAATVVEYEQDIETVLREYLSRESPKTEKRKLTHFKWNNCGGTEEKVTVLSLKPDPVRIPGTLNITAVFDVLHDLNAPISAHINISRYTQGLWINIPCIQQFGSCDYDDICAMLSPVVCPDEIKDCHCPFKQGRHTIKYPDVQIGAELFLSGEYRATANLKKGGKMVGCLSIALSVA